jgi:hypothetical protein
MKKLRAELMGSASSTAVYWGCVFWPVRGNVKASD